MTPWESRLWKERQKGLVKTLGSFNQKLAQSISSAMAELITCTGLDSSRKEPAWRTLDKDSETQVQVQKSIPRVSNVAPWVKVLAAESSSQGSIPGIHNVRGENCLLNVVPHYPACGFSTRLSGEWNGKTATTPGDTSNKNGNFTHTHPHALKY